jgi:hypothetical protein
MTQRMVTLLALATFTLSGCTSYHSQYVSFRPPEGYANYRVVDGVSLGAEAYADPDLAKTAFGFDIKGAGLLPVQIVMDNRGGNSLEIMPGQTFLVDDGNNYWNVVPNATAISRLEKSTQLAAFFGSGAGKGAVIGAAGGAILGAAIGIVSGSNVGSALGKGAAIGGASGAVIGSVQQGTSGERERTIIDDIREKGLEGKVIPPESLANGFLFFPGEAKSAKELRLQYREMESRMVQTVILKLK